MKLPARHTPLPTPRSLLMRPSIRLCAAALPCSLLLSLLLTACGHHYGHSDQAGNQLAFGVDMAKHGLWSEAMFRFHQAERMEPNNPRVENNLGVAYEAAGDYDKALDYYKKALKLDPNSKELRANYARFVEFYQGFKSSDKAGAPAAAKSPTPSSATQPPSRRPPTMAPPIGAPEPSTPNGPPPPDDPRPPC